MVWIWNSLIGAKKTASINHGPSDHWKHRDVLRTKGNKSEFGALLQVINKFN